MSAQSSAGQPRDITEQLLRGERSGIARGISMVEDEHPGAVRILRDVYPNTGRAYRVGITGPPGAGKSTLTNKLAKFFRGQDRRIGIIAVDPTSPFTGGALLGDRVRMTDVELDGGVFIRSMASRGSLGGLGRKTREAADLLDGAGFDFVLIETVGVGQSELDIVRAADTTVVVLVPESGDSIQAMKAGLMEIADFFVVNKGDRPGADQAVMAVKTVLGFRAESDGWKPAVLKTVASNGEGIEAVAAEIVKHREHQTASGELERKRRKRVAERVRELVDERLRTQFWTPDREALLDGKVNEVSARRGTPYEAADELVKSFGPGR